MTTVSPRAAGGPPPPAARPHSVTGSPVDAGLTWVSLTSAGSFVPAADEPVRPRLVVAQIVAAALAVICVVALGGVLVSRHVAERQAVHDAAEQADVLARGVLQPALTDAMLTDPVAAARGLDPVVRTGVLSAALVRVKLWTPQGTVLYSDESRLIGRTYPLDDEARRALLRPETVASVSELSRPENQFERDDGKLLEVYRPVWTPAGRPLLFETYFRYNAVSERSSGLWRGFAGIMLSSLVALLLLLLPVVWSLLGRARRAQQQRQVMMQRALAASDAERRRIAASLHDGAVQQLVASSLQLSAHAHAAERVGDADRAAEYTAAAATVRGSIAELRSLLVDIYPPNVVAAGLAAALHDLAATMSADGVEIIVEVDSTAAERLDPEATEAVFRVAQETLRNAAKHARASTICVRIGGRAEGVLLEIDDDGAGFDVAEFAAARDAALPDGHLGLHLIVDAARSVGAALSLASRVGHGTHYRLEVGAP